MPVHHRRRGGGDTQTECHTGGYAPCTPLPTKVTIVGTNGAYKREILLGHFW